MNFQQFFSRIDKQTMQKSIDVVKEALNTKEGQELANQLKGLDMNALSKKICDPNNEDIQKFVSNLDLGELEQKMGSINKDDVLKAVSRSKDFTGELSRIVNQDK